ncbi:unnamed protein product [Didymodactylos carnosus]|uniref:Uncharacterized protein n=1 Tax=Didymodactylos carnosus TaxID=1234261 RepID=A0A8S2DA02_9BILA|nr:unnamed protein product [Didymodactylos carnosus]CAF3666335.1 unnamed protein product [Didymodactylos carnosus]
MPTENGSSNDDDDELISETDVYLNRTLAEQLYVFQFPIRPHYRPYEDNSFSGARIKKKYQMFEMDSLINVNQANYFKSRGRQFAAFTESSNNKENTNNNKQRYFYSDYMDKQILSTNNMTSDDTNCRYCVGLFENNCLYLCPVKAILQLRPQYTYLDSTATTGVGDPRSKGYNLDERTASDGEHSENSEDEEKPTTTSLITMKFAKKESDYHKKKRLQSYDYYRQLRDDERWEDLVCLMNQRSTDSNRLRKSLIS